jgi:hypothetical protein
MRATIAICYSEITPESAEVGDHSDTGFEVERRPYERGDLRSLGRHEGIHEPSCYPFQPYRGVWWASGYQVIDYGTGTERELTLHLDGVTNATLARVHRYLNREPVLGCKRKGPVENE